MNPWDRQAIDTDESWPYFVNYRDQLPPRRLERVRVPGTVAPGLAHLAAWYRDHQWAQRVAAYDAHLDSILQEEREALVRTTAKELAAKHVTILLDARELVQRELRKLLEASQESEMHGLIKPAELTRLLELTVKLDRLVHGETTEAVDVSFDLSHLSTEELRQLEQLQRKAERP